MKREDLKVGENYIHKNSDKVTRTIKYIGNVQIVYTDQHDIEESMTAKNFIYFHNPAPKPPKNLGQLLMCIKGINDDLTDEHYNLGDLIVGAMGYDREYYRPVTIDSHGDVFGVVE